MIDYRQILPKAYTDRFAFTFTLVGVHAMLYFELFHVLPWTIASDDPYPQWKVYWHIGAAVLFYTNVLGNFWKLLVTDTTSGSKVLPIILKPGWRFCAKCEANAPPRSFHCFLCKKCILKRDHHCVFSGNCIGHSSQRYFIGFLVWCWVAGVYANIVTFPFTWSVLGDVTLLHIFEFIFPLFCYILGQVGSLYEVYVCIHSILLIIVTSLLTGLLGYHLQNIYNGQIAHERAHRIKNYDLGWRENIKAVFGKNWYLALLFPAISSPLPGDGIDFPTKQTFEMAKNM